MMVEKSTPDHIAVIMDGNRRWARAQGKPAHAGHHQGAGNVEAVAEACHAEGVSWLTLFAFSTENWNRSTAEINALMTVFRHFLSTKQDTLTERNIRLRIIGELGGFDPDIMESLGLLVDRTAGNGGLNLTVALGYGGKADLAQAARRIGERIASGDLDPGAVDEQLIKGHLSTADLPPVDLLIRTGREQRLSNFLLWDTAYAEFAFSETLWPDFGARELKRIIRGYRLRDRRFGGDAPVEAITPNKRLIGQA